MVAMILVLMATGFWMFVEYDVMKRKYTKSTNVTKKAKKNNTLLITVTIFCFGSLYITFFNQWHDPTLWVWSCIGSVIALLGMFMRRTAIQTLGKHFDGLVQLKKGQELIQHGLYRYFRHPSYTGTIIAFFGFGVASMSAVNAFLFPALYVVCYYFRIQYEEAVLLDGFGDEYKMYQTKTWRLLPWFKRPMTKEKNQTL